MRQGERRKKIAMALEYVTKMKSLIPPVIAALLMVFKPTSKHSTVTMISVTPLPCNILLILWCYNLKEWKSESHQLKPKTQFSNGRKRKA